MDMQTPPRSARGVTPPRVSPMTSAGLTMFKNAALAEGSYGGGALSAREPLRLASTGEDSSLADRELSIAAASFFTSDAEKEEICNARHKYPARKTKQLSFDPLTGAPEEHIPRRIMGFGLGFEKIFATTSTKLPVSAYTIFVELHASHNQQVFNRCFNGLHTVFDLKKWIFENVLVPMSAYDLSYAEPGKAAITDQLRLLTTQDSLDTRTMATTRAVHAMYKGIPGVHSIGDIGVTRLYMRLKCRTCGDLLNSLQKCRRYKTFSDIEATPEPDWMVPAHMRKDGQAVSKQQSQTPKARGALAGSQPNAVGVVGVPGQDPNIEDRWYKPDEKKHCLFHGRGFEMYEAARTHGGHAELGKIFISCGKEPSQKLKVAENTSSRLKEASTKISY